MPKTNTFTQKEIAVAINNAVVAAKSPNKLGELTEARLKKLRAYAMSLLAPVQEHLDAAFLRPEEGVFIFLAAALFLQTNNVMETRKLPMVKTAEIVLEGKVCETCGREFETLPEE